MKKIGLIAILSFLASHLLFASSRQAPDKLLDSLKLEISKGFNSAEIEWSGPIRWIQNRPANVGEDKVIFLGSDGRGNARFSITNSVVGVRAEGWISFLAWIPAKVALRRIRPGEVLSPDMFQQQRVNVSSGQVYDYRGILYPGNREISNLESIQTLLEGQVLITSAIQRTPDVRRGDSVRVNVVSNGLTLTTLGTAEDSGYLNRQIRVRTASTKRELLGKLRAEGVVEVKL